MRNISDWKSKRENTSVNTSTIANLSFSMLLNDLNEPVCIVIKWLFGISNMGQQSNNPEKKHANMNQRLIMHFQVVFTIACYLILKYDSSLMESDCLIFTCKLRKYESSAWSHLSVPVYTLYAPCCRKLHYMNYQYSERATILKWLQTAAISKWTDAITFVQIAHTNSLQK